MVEVYNHGMRLTTLGGLALEGSGFSRQKPLLLLAYLALEGAKERRYLAELFWMGSPDPRNNLGTAIAQLRKASPGVIEADRTRAWTAVDCDASDLLGAFERADFDRARDLYRGPFLDGMDTQNAGIELEEWIYGTREHLARLGRRVLLESAEGVASRGAYSEAAQYAERAYLLREAPPPEPDEYEKLHHLLVAGEHPRAAEVRSEAQEYEMSFPASTAKARETLRGPERVDQTPRNNLPPAATSFVGRDLEIIELSEQLAKPECRILSLIGTAGVGKSRLALRLAREELTQDRYEDGIFFVPLDALTRPTTIPASIATALGIELAGTMEPLAQICLALGEKRTLLVLDNYEHVLEGAPLASKLVRSCPHLKLLITSRERLHLTEEWVYPLEGLKISPEEDHEEEQSRHAEAVRLFHQRAKRTDLRFTLSPEVLPDVLRICRAVEGLPLGIELAAAWTRALPVSEIAERIAEELDLFTSLDLGVPARHRNLQAAFEYSWRLLSRKEQEVLKDLAVFRGGFRKEAASAVVGSSIPVLASLVDKSLLRLASNGRYDRHPLVFQFTREKLSEDPERQIRTSKKHGEFFRSFLLESSARLSGPETRRVLADLEEDLENIRAAWGWAIAEIDVDTIEQMIFPLMWTLESRERRSESIELMNEIVSGLESADPAHHTALGRALASLAYSVSRLGQVQRGSELARRGLEMLRPSNDVEGILIGLQALATALWYGGDYEGVLSIYEEGVELARREQASEQLAQFLWGLAYGHLSLGEFQTAEALATEALSLHRALDDRTWMALDINMVGQALFRSGRMEKALEHFQAGLRFASEGISAEIETESLGFVGRAALALGDTPKAWECFTERLRMSRESGNAWQQVWSLGDLARIFLESDDHPRAEAHLREGLRLASSMHAVQAELEIMLILGELSSRRGQAERAVEHFSLVGHHPGAEHHQKDAARQQLEGIRDQLPTDEFTRAAEAGRNANLREVVAGIVGHSSAHAQQR